jgi:hypothetical protein
MAHRRIPGLKSPSKMDVLGFSLPRRFTNFITAFFKRRYYEHLTFSEKLDEILTEQLMKDFAFLAHLQENARESLPDAHILSQTVICELCFKPYVKYQRDIKFMVAGKQCCVVCACLQLKRICEDLLTFPQFAHPIFAQVASFLNPAFFESKLPEVKAYEQPNQ